MKRDRQKPLHFPILVEAETEENTDGYGGFPRGTLSRALRAVEPGEIIQKLKSGKIFRGKERNLWDGLESMRTAYRRLDNGKLKEATEMLRPWITWGEVRDEPDEMTRERARWDYSSLMSNSLERARMVVWWTEGRERLLAPAVYCPDWETAAFATLFVGGIRLCPKCNRPFEPKKDNQEYCRAAHGGAHRTARSRDAKKQAEVGGRDVSGDLPGAAARPGVPARLTP